MPIALRLFLFAALSVAGLVVACGGDDEGEPTATSTRTATPRDTDGGSSPDGESPGPDETGDATPTEASGPTRAPEGTPAVEPANTTEYLAQFQGRDDVVQEICQYDPTTFIVDCPDRARFAIDPPIRGQDISCTIGVVGGTAEYINCRSEEPRVSHYYEIQ